jgi:hypothetical protein
MVLLHEPPPIAGLLAPDFVIRTPERVMWRSWVLAPGKRLHGGDTVLLTGIFGFRWPATTMQAKCAAADHDRVGLGPQPRYLDRHHRVVPDPSCGCGIYASSDLAVTPGGRLLPIGKPIVTGFVDLAGAVVADGSTVRAQQATIVGPLAILPGRPSVPTRMMHQLGIATEPATVIREHDGYRVTWGGATVGTPYAQWLRWAARELSVRYGVDVI